MHLKEIYIILAFHAHELLWDLPEKLLSYLDEENPMRDTILDQNILRNEKRKAGMFIRWGAVGSIGCSGLC